MGPFGDVTSVVRNGRAVSYYDTCDDVDVGHCFTGPHTAVVESESDSDEECVLKRQRYW